MAVLGSWCRDPDNRHSLPLFANRFSPRDRHSCSAGAKIREVSLKTRVAGARGNPRVVRSEGIRATGASPRASNATGNSPPGMAPTRRSESCSFDDFSWRQSAWYSCSRRRAAGVAAAVVRIQVVSRRRRRRAARTHRRDTHRPAIDAPGARSVCRPARSTGSAGSRGGGRIVTTARLSPSSLTRRVSPGAPTLPNSASYRSNPFGHGLIPALDSA